MNAWVPFFQSGLWVALIIVAGVRYGTKLEGVFDVLIERIRRGSSVKAGPFEVGPDLKSLDRVERSAIPAASTNDWTVQRDETYRRNHGIFLVHVIEPSSTPGQLYNVFIFLVGHKRRTLGDVESAEFFLGRYWDNKVFRETEKNGVIGISTTAYGPVLCTCRVTMKDGQQFCLDRYIDFEMGRVFGSGQIRLQSH